ncbi:hypothetical protein CF326_g9705, partial [Tilletia indica]
MAGSSSAATRGTTGGKKRTSPVKPTATTDTFSQPKLTFSSKPRQDQHSYFISPSPPRPQPKPQRIKKPTSTENHHSQATPSQLWVDRFPPTTTASLAVHRAKIDQVRTWLSEALTAPPSIRAYRRLLVLTGPSGSGKSATIRALSSSQELDFDIVEWENTWGNNIGAEFTPSSASSQAGPSRFVSTSQSATQLFADFLASSSRFGTLEMASDQPDDNTGGDGLITTARPTSTLTASTSTLPTTSQLLMPPPPPPLQPPSSQSTDTKNKTRRIILLDD